MFIDIILEFFHPKTILSYPLLHFHLVNISLYQVGINMLLVYFYDDLYFL